MRFYHALGWGVPAVLLGEGPLLATPIPDPDLHPRPAPHPHPSEPVALGHTWLSWHLSPTGLAVGLDPEGYGNPDFCWISIHEPLIWSFAGPVVLVVMVSGTCALVGVGPCSWHGGIGRGAIWPSASFHLRSHSAGGTGGVRSPHQGLPRLSPRAPSAALSLTLAGSGACSPWFPALCCVRCHRSCLFRGSSSPLVSLAPCLPSDPAPPVWPRVQMNGTMFLLAAHASCSAGQREAKKTSVL